MASAAAGHVVGRSVDSLPSRKEAGPARFRTDPAFLDLGRQRWLGVNDVEDTSLEERWQREYGVRWLACLLVFGALFAHCVLAGFNRRRQFRFFAFNKVLGIRNGILRLALESPALVSDEFPRFFPGPRCI